MVKSKLSSQRYLLWLVLPFSLVIAALFLGFTFFSPETHEDSDVEIVKEWNLPNELEEISGIAYLSENKIACIQDELGSIFIFDLSLNKISRKFQFGREGDYEGICIVGKTAFVLRSDGSLFEITDFNSEETPLKTISYPSPFPKGIDVEGLSYDENANRLLLLVKENEKGNRTEYKEVFAFDLASKSFQQKPIYKLEFPFEKIKNKIKFRPSEIAMNNEDLYVLLSKNPMIIRFEQAKAKEIYQLNKDIFPQPEGMTFGPNRKIYISSEGSPGKLFEIKLIKK